VTRCALVSRLTRCARVSRPRTLSDRTAVSNSRGVLGGDLCAVALIDVETCYR
jgi:hypothetical protein